MTSAVNQQDTSRRAELEARISSAVDGEDSIDAYTEYAQWLVDVYGEKDKNSGLLNLLERAIVQLPIGGDIDGASSSIDNQNPRMPLEKEG